MLSLLFVWFFCLFGLLATLRENFRTDLYRDTGKMCLGGGMHCPSASSYGRPA